MDLFTELIDGEENMPPKIATPPKPDVDKNEQESNKTNIVDSFGNLQIYDQVLAQQPAVGTKRPNQQAQRKKQTKPIAASRDPAPTGPQAPQPVGEDGDWELDPRMGEESEVGMSYVPWLAVAKFPYKFINPSYKERVDVNFFAGGKLYTRGWDFYYAWYDNKAVPFVTKPAFEDLLKDIHKAFPGLDWKFEQRNIDEGLLATFDSPNPDHRPRFLGHTDVKENYNHFINHAPSEPNIMNSLAGPDDDRSLQAFMARMELAADIGKNKSKGIKRAKQAEMVVKRQEMTKQVLRAQQYLGLTPTNTSGTTPAIDFTTPAPHPFDKDVIFISIDVEAYERSSGIITEVGIATLDTRDLHDLPPGKNGVDWQPKIRARHFRIIEHKKYVNREFVQGCPERFEFGTSEWIGLNAVASELAKCFHEPFSGPVSTNQPQQEERKLILLGHDTYQDIQYLSKLGFAVLNRGNLLEVMDTAAMYRSYTRSPNASNLGSIVHGFDFSPWNLHNAGNDAVYTVWGMLAICVADAAERGTGEAEKRLEKARVEKEEKAVAMVRERAKAESEGWGVSAEPAGDGEKVGSDEWGEVYTSGGAVLDV